jgi:NAD(P)-dependent dehydrogenase (short-subunit alcohol dehydrogenase family)
MIGATGRLPPDRIDVDPPLLFRKLTIWSDRGAGTNPGAEPLDQERPIRRFGRVEEITPTALLLASAPGSFYVGQTLSPNGGDVMI